MIDKERALREALSSLGSVVVAYSGGVDSAYLACVAHERRVVRDDDGLRCNRTPRHPLACIAVVRRFSLYSRSSCRAGF